MRTPSIMMAVKEREVEDVWEFRKRLNDNTKAEKAEARERFEELKNAVKSYDNDQIETITNEYEIGSRKVKDLGVRTLGDEITDENIPDIISTGAKELRAKFKNEFKD
jgi:hypothetical protein